MRRRVDASSDTVAAGPPVKPLDEAEQEALIEQFRQRLDRDQHWFCVIFTTLAVTAVVVLALYSLTRRLDPPFAAVTRSGLASVALGATGGTWMNAVLLAQLVGVMLHLPSKPQGISRTSMSILTRSLITASFVAAIIWVAVSWGLAWSHLSCFSPPSPSSSVFACMVQACLAPASVTSALLGAWPPVYHVVVVQADRWHRDLQASIHQLDGMKYKHKTL